MYHNITLKLMFFAGDKEEWRVYTDSGQYWTAKTIDDIGEAIKNLIISSAEITIKKLKEKGQD